MSQENVEIVRRATQAWSDHDREARDQILGIFDSWEDEWSDIRWEIDELIDVDDDTVVTLHGAIATGRSSGIETVRELGAVTELRDGLIVSQRIYLDRAEALRAAGFEGPHPTIR